MYVNIVKNRITSRFPYYPKSQQRNSTPNNQTFYFELINGIRKWDQREVSTLCGHHDDLQGSGDVMWQRQVAFKNRWQGLHLFSDTNSSLNRNYDIPSFMLHS